MRYAGFLATLVAGVMVASLGAAQTVRQAGLPQPAPPSGFEGSQYVDSRGCVYIRAGISGEINWVPRVGADRRPICGAPASSVRPPVVAEAPTTQSDEEAAPSSRETAEAPRVVRPAATAPERRTASANPAQRIVDVPRGQTRTQRVAAEEARPAEPARQLTLSQVCAGRSGPVEGFIVARTGAPVTCGAPARTARVTAAAPADPTPTRVTRRDICARIARTGESFIDSATGEPVACSNTATARAATFARAPATQRTIAAPRVTARRPVHAAAAASGGASCPGISAQAEAFLREIGAPVDCGPWARGTARADVPASNVEAPAERLATLSSRGSAAPVRAGPVAVPETPIFRQPVPASNPSAGNPARTISSPPSGYRSVWDDGRVNTSRGLARSYF